MKKTTVTLMSARSDVHDLVVSNVTTYRVGHNLIWIEYNNGESIIAVKRVNFRSMHIAEHEDINIQLGYERINCEPYGNQVDKQEQELGDSE